MAEQAKKRADQAWTNLDADFVFEQELAETDPFGQRAIGIVKTLSKREPNPRAVQCEVLARWIQALYKKEPPQLNKIMTNWGKSFVLGLYLDWLLQEEYKVFLLTPSVLVQRDILRVACKENGNENLTTFLFKDLNDGNFRFPSSKNAIVLVDEVD